MQSTKPKPLAPAKHESVRGHRDFHYESPTSTMGELKCQSLTKINKYALGLWHTPIPPIGTNTLGRLC